MAELTPRDDIKKAVSEILKRVDQLLKAFSLEEARQQIARAKEIDPKNVYVFAYEERLNLLIQEKKARDEEEARRKAEEEKRQKEEEARRKQQEEQRRVEEEKRRKEEEAKRKQEEDRKRKEEASREAAAAELAKRKSQEVHSEARGPVPDIPRSVLEETKKKILED